MLELHGHPFALYTWKPLIALHERGTPFTFVMLDGDDPDSWRPRLAEWAPTGQFPVLIDDGRVFLESNIVVERLDAHGDAQLPRMIPDDPEAALEARMLADVFDDYIAGPSTRVVANALRPPEERDPRGVADAQAALDRAYAWLDRRLAGRAWAAGEAFTIADCAGAPALFYADWVRPIPEACAGLRAYRAQVLARPSVARVVEGARPYRRYFPLGAPDRD